MEIIAFKYRVPDFRNLVLMLSFNIFSSISFNGNMVMKNAHSEECVKIRSTFVMTLTTRFNVVCQCHSNEDTNTYNN